MLRPTLVLALCLETLAAASGCGAADSLSTEPPVEAGIDTSVGDAPPADLGTADQQLPPKDAAKDTPAIDATPADAPPADTLIPDVLTPWDGDIPDTGAHTTKGCTNSGGVLCTQARWELCPIGFEPVAAGDSHFNCGQGQEGWCCQPAPPSSCSMSGAANCVVNACTGCFAPSQDKALTCEPGRACCVDMCN